MVKVLVFGDSISWGAFDIERGGWVERLKTHYLKDYFQSEVGVYNFSVSGNTSIGVLKFLQTDIDKIEFIENEEQVHIFAIGTNDSTQEGSIENDSWISVEEYIANIETIISISKQYTKKIIFIGDFNINEDLTLPWRDSNLYWKNSTAKKYENSLEEICQKYSIPLIPTKDIITLEDLSDGLHPNSKGHERIFQRIKEFLENNEFNFY